LVHNQNKENCVLIGSFRHLVNKVLVNKQHDWSFQKDGGIQNFHNYFRKIARHKSKGLFNKSYLTTYTYFNTMNGFKV